MVLRRIVSLIEVQNAGWPKVTKVVSGLRILEIPDAEIVLLVVVRGPRTPLQRRCNLQMLFVLLFLLLLAVTYINKLVRARNETKSHSLSWAEAWVSSAALCDRKTLRRLRSFGRAF